MAHWNVKWLNISILVLLFLPFISRAQNSRLVPDDIVIQHAGSIGYFSAGAGYDLFRNKRGSLHLLYGYVPRSKGGRLDVVTAKFAYRPFKIHVTDIAVIYPANPGVFFSYTMGEDLSFSFDRSQYAKNYYGWSESLRSHLSLSNELELNGKKIFGGKKIKGVVLYSEFNASDLYLVSWAINREALSFLEIFKLGIGARVKF